MLLDGEFQHCCLRVGDSFSVARWGSSIAVCGWPTISVLLDGAGLQFSCLQVGGGFSAARWDYIFVICGWLTVSFYG